MKVRSTRSNAILSEKSQTAKPWRPDKGQDARHGARRHRQGPRGRCQAGLARERLADKGAHAAEQGATLPGRYENLRHIQRERDRLTRCCREYRLSPGSNPERFDPDGHLVNESGARIFDPEDPERLGEEVIGMRNRVRMAKCLLIDDQMAMVREVWPQVVQLDEGVADLGDIVVQATENSCRVTEKP